MSITTRAVAGAKDLLVAQRFGISAELDAFIVASLLPASILYAVGASAADAFLPLFVRERARSRETAARLLGSTIALSSVALLGVAAILALAAPAIVRAVGSSFDHPTADLATFLLVALVPTLLIGGWSAVWPAVLNVSGRHAVTAAVPLVTPLVTIALLLAPWPAWGVALLAAGAVAGVAVEAAILGAVMLRAGHAIVPRWRGLDPAEREFVRQFVGLLLAALIALGSGVIDQAMAASIGPGAASAFSYAGKVLVLVTGLAGIVLTFVVLPRFSQLVADGQRSRLRSAFGLGAVGGLLAGAAMGAVLAVWSSPIIRLLLERGSFGAGDTAMVAPIQAVLAIQLPFTLVGLLAIRLLVALGAARIIVLTSVLGVGLHYAGNLILIPPLGVRGIALSATVSSVILFGVLAALAFRQLGRRGAP